MLYISSRLDRIGGKVVTWTTISIALEDGMDNVLIVYLTNLLYIGNEDMSEYRDEFKIGDS